MVSRRFAGAAGSPLAIQDEPFLHGGMGAHDLEKFKFNTQA
jgi:hypothetical protein